MSETRFVGVAVRLFNINGRFLAVNLLDLQLGQRLLLLLPI